MALTKEIIVDKYEIVGEYKKLQIRDAIVIKEDGVELSRSHHRRVLNPLNDVSSESTEIQQLTAILWTDEVRSAFSASIAESDNLV
jgi:hypothetical protein|tara:strand:+ start:247 stop:504 length:258 start_codon:yes stop_codon:yes gene_type:complete